MTGLRQRRMVMDSEMALVALCLLLASVLLLLSGEIGLAMLEFLGFYLFCYFAGE